MDPKQKTAQILDVLGKRSTIPPEIDTYDVRLSGVAHLPWDELFSAFNPKHAQIAAQLIEILLKASEFEDYINLLDDIRKLNNDRLFLYVLYSSVAHREDCQDVILPSILECAPHWYFAAETIHKAIQLSIHFPNQNHTVINMKTAEDSEPESRVSYFREDIGINSHHWAWHVTFPFYWDPEATGKIIDRKGEMFYYMHEQMVARYNCERLSSGLDRVLPLQEYEKKLVGYFPHMTSQVTGVHLSSRSEGTYLRDTPTISIQEMEIWTLRILEAIDLGYVRDKHGDKISLDNVEGINILGAIVESSLESVNRDFYGNLHNTGHNAVGYSHDPAFRFKKHPGVMAFIESAPRDPVFFQWHKHIDNIFTRHKNTLKPYTGQELSFEAIEIVSAEINCKEKNVIETFMKEEYSDFSHAPFLETKAQILVKYEHLDLTSFTYTFDIKNSGPEEKKVTIRIFLGPKYDETGKPLDINEQRRLMIELDKFQRVLQPGSNTVNRHSKKSSVTAPRKKGFKDILEGNVEPELDYCSCGWPENLLVPKGKPEGMDFVLFAMCTDYAQDSPAEVLKKSNCADAISYCGAKDQKYPDKKPMGFPFDRKIVGQTKGRAITLDEFAEHSNMILTDVKIKFVGSPATC